MKRTGIIGGGFSGTMTAVQLIRAAHEPLELILFNKSAATFFRGTAYAPFSKSLLLNVTAARMSAFPDQPDDFLNWLLNRKEFRHLQKKDIAGSFVSRDLYGQYLEHTWNDAHEAARDKGIKISSIPSEVKEIELSPDHVTVNTGAENIKLDFCVLASGNNIPGNPEIEDPSFFSTEHYFGNPWDISSVLETDPGKPILIAGNGLTMIDTVIALRENGFSNEIYSVSPNGFNILPHQDHADYPSLASELHAVRDLRSVVSIVNTHIKRARKNGIPSEAVVDSLRPLTQEIWKNLSETERRTFMSRLRHLWGMARHRIPVAIHEDIQEQLRDRKLHIIAGRLVSLENNYGGVTVTLHDKHTKEIRKLEVSRVINCTGPETNLMKQKDPLLKNCLEKGYILQDTLKLGIRTNTETFETYDSRMKAQPRLMALGPLLKGELWESTAVNELRSQAALLAKNILYKMKG